MRAPVSACLALLGLLSLTSASAQETPLPEPLPPPGMDEPGPPPATEAQRRDAPVPEKLPPPPSEEEAPTVTIRTSETGDRVEEYRQGGRLYMVKVTPLRGPAYYLMDTDGDGRLDSSKGDAPVAPVYWKLYEWN